jgi:glycosyltransferase involved in cell wall biosynthesis
MREHTFDAIVVNADPHAALLVGAQLSRESGIPLVLDLRDPWSVCELRRGERPWLQRRLVDAMERRCVEQASAVILNTETTRRDYLAHYADQPAAKFHVIRNHGDAALIANGSFARDPRYTALFLGNFRRYVEGDELLEALALLKARGIDETKFHLVVTGRVPAEARAYADKLGVAAMLTEGAFVPYRQVGSFMETADLLVALNNRTVQRVPAKVYDYLVSPRPMLVVADNPELGEMLAPLPYAELRSLDDIAGIADSMAASFALGTGFAVDRSEAGYDSATASAKLAAILSSVRRPQ